MAEQKHELSDVQIRPVATTLAIISVTVALVLLLMHWLFNYFATHQPKPAVEPSPLVETQQLPPEPRLQASPARDLRELRAAEDAVLNTYGWIDPKAGTIRIPIDRAMDLLAERGLPARKQ